MKVSDGGEAFFVFETDGDVPSHLITSPVISPVASPSSSPRSQSPDSPTEPDFLDLSKSRSSSPGPSPFLQEPFLASNGGSQDDLSTSQRELTSRYPYSQVNHQFAESFPNLTRTRSSTLTREQAIERAQNLTQKLRKVNISSKVTDNGDVVMDMTGYKSGEADIQESEQVVKRILAEEFGETDLEALMRRDTEGHLRIFAPVEDTSQGYTSDDASSEYNVPSTPPGNTPHQPIHAATFPNVLAESLNEGEHKETDKVYAKTLRLTSDQLKLLKLKPGANDVSFTVLQSKAQCTARMFYWRFDVPLVISDIDGTITKSDALGHVLAMIGRDWTHPGVGKLFTDIESNGYHIMYLTARSVGQADSTRYYLQGVSQEGYKLPDGPVILSPDRTMAALRREVIMKKPEVFKMACLRDIKSLYGNLEETPFYAGFGNRITDALSYRSVGVPSSRIFTINPNGDVHLELLELSGYKSSYVSISDLVDHFFPPAGYFRGQETYTDLAYWREPIPDLSEWESENSSEDEAKSIDTTRSFRHKDSRTNASVSASIPGSPQARQEEELSETERLELSDSSSSPHNSDYSDEDSYDESDIGYENESLDREEGFRDASESEMDEHSFQSEEEEQESLNSLNLSGEIKSLSQSFSNKSKIDDPMI